MTSIDFRHFHSRLSMYHQSIFGTALYTTRFEYLIFYEDICAFRRIFISFLSLYILSESLSERIYKIPADACHVTRLLKLKTPFFMKYIVLNFVLYHLINSCCFYRVINEGCPLVSL
jgi:hypothetical protein